MLRKHAVRSAPPKREQRRRAGALGAREGEHRNERDRRKVRQHALGAGEEGLERRLDADHAPDAAQARRDGTLAEVGAHVEEHLCLGQERHQPGIVLVGSGRSDHACGYAYLLAGNCHRSPDRWEADPVTQPMLRCPYDPRQPHAI